MSLIDSPPMVVGGLLAGFAFGFLLQKGQVSKYRVIVGQFLLVDWTVVKIMFTAVVVGAIGVNGMLALGLIDHLLVKPAVLAGVALGGLLFGIGMTGVGYCPGTGIAAAAQGSRSAWFAFLGGLFGAAVFAEVFPVVDRTLYALVDLGKVTLPDVTGVPAWVFVAGLVVVAAIALPLIQRYEPKTST
jgi:uncharacterized membrane protein YedE/YeeE